MRVAADYFGLMAYLLVMYGGLPDREALWSETPARARGKGRLRLIEGGPSRRPAPTPAPVAEVEDAVA